MARIKRAKRVKIPMKKSVGARYALLLICFILFVLCTFAAIIDVVGTESNTLSDYLDQVGKNEALFWLLLPFHFMVICILCIWYMLISIAYFLPTFVAFILVIMALVFLRSSGAGGRYCYKYERNRKSGKAASIIMIVFALVGVITLFVSTYLFENVKTGNSAQTEGSAFMEAYKIATYVICGLSLLFGLATLLDVKQGITLAQEEGQLSEQEEIQNITRSREQIKTTQQGDGYALGGVTQTLQVSPKPTNKDK